MTRRSWPAWSPLLLLAGLCLLMVLLALRGPDDTLTAQALSAADGSADSAAAADGLEFADDPLATYTPPPPDAYDIVVARNLFDVNRQPPPDNAASGGDNAGSVQSRDFALEGILRGPARQVAILLDKRASKAVRVVAGDSYGGWVLETVDNRHVVLSRGAETLRLDLPGITREAAASALTENGVPLPRQMTIQPRRGDARGNPVRAQRRPLASQTIQPDSQNP